MELFQIPQIVRDLEASLPEDGELTDEQIRQIDTLGLNLKDLVTSACTIIAEEEALAETAKSQVARLQALHRSHEGRARRWKTWIKHALVATKQRKLSTDWFDVGLYKNSQPTVILQVHVDELPEKYLRYPAAEVDKQKIIEDYKAAVELPAGVQVIQGEHVRIR